MAFSFESYKSLVVKIVTREVAQSWARNGHKLTNALVDNLKVDVNQKVNSILIEGFMFDYGSAMNDGVPASRIPFERGSGAGKSLYIEGLEKYVNLRMGLSGKEALGVAFAIATKQKKLGMPIRTRGGGTKWIDKSMDKMLPEIANLSARFTGEVIDVTLRKIKI